MPSIHLFGTRLSPFVEKTLRALEFKRAEYDLVEPRVFGDFGTWNPQTSKMPALRWDHETLYDSTLISRELDKRIPAPALWSTDPPVVARQRLLEDWSDESFYWLLLALRFSAPHIEASVEQVMGLLSSPRILRPLIRARLKRWLGGMVQAQGTGRLPYTILCQELELRVGDLATLLGREPFFFSDTLSPADLAIHGQINTGTSGPTPEFDAALDQHDTLRAWRKRVEEATGG